MKSPSPRLFARVFWSLAAVLVLAAGCSKSSEPKDSRYMGLGDDAISEGRVRRAILCYEKEIELNPSNPAPHLKLALIYEHIQPDRAKMEQHYDQYFKLEKNDARRERVQAWRKDAAETEPPDGVVPAPTDLSPGDDEPPGPAFLDQLQAARRKLAAAEQENGELAAKIIQLQDDLDAATDSLALVTKERDALKTQAGSAESLATLQKAFDDLKAQHETSSAKAAKDLDDLKKQLATLEARNKELEASLTSAGRRALTDKLDEARAALREAERKNDEYAKQVEALRATIARLEASSAGTGATRKVTHVVKEGETLTQIALKYYGSKERWTEIYEANRSEIPDPNKIQPGQKLIIPLSDSE